MRVHFILYVADQASGRDFWRATLGLAPALDVPGMTEFALGDVVLGIMPESGIERLLGGRLATTPRSSRAEVYLVVDDPGAYQARAIAAGARELSSLQPRDWGHEVAYCLAPDGHVVAFARPSG